MRFAFLNAIKLSMYSPTLNMEPGRLEKRLKKQTTVTSALDPDF